MLYSVDRFENGFAVCENEDMKIVNIPLINLPEGVKEGSVLIFEDGKYTLSEDEESKRRNRILSLQNDIFSE